MELQSVKHDWVTFTSLHIEQIIKTFEKLNLGLEHLGVLIIKIHMETKTKVE